MSTIHLFPALTIAELNQAFSAQYPFLKIEFFTRPHHTFEGSPAHLLIRDHARSLGEINPDLLAGDLPLLPGLPVRDVEQLLETHFGLHAQVFRKSKGSWLVTSTTDTLSLAEQNALGQAAEQVASPEEMPDYREQD